MPGVAGIADDVLTKGDSEMSHNIAVISVLETAQSNKLKFNTDKHAAQDYRMQVLLAATNPGGDEY